MKPIQIFPSLISADLLNLQQQIDLLSPYCAGLHIDVMDNHYVPNLTWGAQFVNAITHYTSKPCHVHVMIDNADNFLETLQCPKGTIIQFHRQTVQSVDAMTTAITNKGWLPSIAISPKDRLEDIYPYLSYVQHVLLMSVHPGFSGQAFLPESVGRLEQLVAYCKQNMLDISISMDGGIGHENSAMLHHKGANSFAVAAAIFDGGDVVENVKRFK